jgi:hypothetical protein
MKKVIIFFLLLLILPAITNAQDSLKANLKYINFEINRVPLISGGYFLQDGLALEAGIALAFDGESNSNGLGIKVGLDKYFSQAKLSPLAGGYVRFDINPNAFGATGWKGSRIIFGGQWGLNYMVFSNLAVAGTIGGELSLNSPKDDTNSSNLSSFTSGLKIRFFF